MKFIPHDYQKKAIDFLIKKQKAALFADMGMGKTAIILKVLHELMYDRLEIARPLIVSPLSVTYNVWPNELKKWDFSKDIPYKILHDKTRNFNFEPSTLTFTNYETLLWEGMNKYWKEFDCVVFDESSFVKNHRARRYRIARKIAFNTQYTYLLTGTPSPNGLLDLWGQIALLDGGARLGWHKTDYKHAFFIAPFITYGRWMPRKGAMQEIIERIKDITMVLRREDWGSIPPVQYIDVPIQLPKKVMDLYKKFERDFVLEMEDTKVAAFNQAAMGNKLRQVIQGFVYDENGTAKVVHWEKINMLKDIITSRPNDQFLIAINFRQEYEMIKKVFPKAKVIYGGTPQRERVRLIKNWNNRKQHMLVVHPASMGHGVNLQHGGNCIIWTGPTWNLEHWLQMNARLDRQGQRQKVVIYTLTATGTKDERVAKLLKDKNMTQKKLLRGLVQ